MSSPMDIDKKWKYILILGKSTTQELDDTTLAVEAQYLINFSRPKIKFSLSLHFNCQNSFLFANPSKIYQLKAKNSEIKNISFA